MTEIISINSFRGGTGKSTITSNLASILANNKKKVVIIDTDIRSPGIHAIFGLNESHFDKTFTDYLFSKASIDDITYDISQTINAPDEQLLLVPSSMRYGQITQSLSAQSSHRKLRKVIQQLADEYRPDYIFIDTHPGVNEENLMTAGFADKLLIIVRPDSQDYQGAEVTTTIVKKLGKKAVIVMNKLHPKLKTAHLKQFLEQKYGVPVAGALPFDENLMFAESKYVFSIKNPEHQFSQVMQRIASQLFELHTAHRLDITRQLLSKLKSKSQTEKSLAAALKLDAKNLKDYLKLLEEESFIVQKNKGFGITSKGKEYLSEFDRIQSFIGDFGL